MIKSDIRNSLHTRWTKPYRQGLSTEAQCGWPSGGPNRISRFLRPHRLLLFLMKPLRAKLRPDGSTVALSCELFCRLSTFATIEWIEDSKTFGDTESERLRWGRSPLSFGRVATSFPVSSSGYRIHSLVKGLKKL